MGMRYNPALDGIRALAVLAVVCHHAFVPGFENGRAGVDVFFVLSGYLITSLLAKEQEAGGIRFGAFYLRRARRLYPALLLMVGLVMAVAPAFEDRPGPKDAFVALTYLSDYAASFFNLPADPLKQTWSLAVEEHFYLLWPLAVMGLLRLPKRARIYLLIVAYLVVTEWRLRLTGQFTLSYFRFDTHCSGLILGSLLAFVPPSRWWALAVVPLAWFTLAWEQPPEVVIVPSEWLGAALVLWAASGSARMLHARPLTFLGRISYGVYLFHWPIVVFYRGGGYSWLEMLWPSLAGGICLATLSYFGVEQWIRSSTSASRTSPSLPIRFARQIRQPL